MWQTVNSSVWSRDTERGHKRVERGDVPSNFSAVIFVAFLVFVYRRAQAES